MTLSLDSLVHDLASAFKTVDASAPQGKSKTRIYTPGIGPLNEAVAIALALQHLKASGKPGYHKAGPRPYPGRRQICDLVIPDEWAVELKLLRPFGDIGLEAEHWSEDILHPYPGNVSAIGDSLKLLASSFLEKKAIIVLGYEHSPPKIPLEPALRAFEAIMSHVMGIEVGPRCSASFEGCIHPVHQQGRVVGWELPRIWTAPRDVS